jgi:hypothetical protein
MGSCKIQRPTGVNSNGGEHGKLYAQITCNDVAGDEHRFDATKGDLRLHLICEEEEGFAFYIGDDTKEAIEILEKKIDKNKQELEKKIDDLAAKIDDLDGCECELDITEFEDYMMDNPIDTSGLDPSYTQDTNNLDLANFFYFMNNNPI